MTIDPDCLDLLIGPPKVGKTSLMAELLHGDLGAGEYVFAHDPNLQLKRICVVYETIGDWLRAAKESLATNTPMPRGAAIIDAESPWQLGGLVGDGGKGNPNAGLVTFVYHLGHMVNSDTNRRLPITFASDEITLLPGCSASYVSKDLERLWANRRHRGVRMRLNMQRPTQLPEGVYDLLTSVYVFKQNNQGRIKTLEDRISLPPGTLEPSATIDKHRFFQVEPGRGIV